jgi:Fur family ferric uptake transcriptional regulator
VYRNILTRVEESWLTPVELPGEAKRNEVAGKDHQHLPLQQLWRVFELEACSIDTKSKLPRGFRASGHEFFIYGHCSACR